MVPGIVPRLSRLSEYAFAIRRIQGEECAEWYMENCEHSEAESLAANAETALASPQDDDLFRFVPMAVVYMMTMACADSGISDWAQPFTPDERHAFADGFLRNSVAIWEALERNGG